MVANTLCSKFYDNNVHYVLVQDDVCNTPLMAAIHKGHTHVVESLVKYGANVNYRNKVRPSITNSH